MQQASNTSLDTQQPATELSAEGAGVGGGGAAEAMRAALKETEGYDAQRSLVSPDGGAQQPPEAERPAETPEGAGAAEGGGARSADAVETADGQSAGSTGDAEGGGEQQADLDMDVLDALMNRGAPRADTGALLAPRRRGRAPKRRQRRKPAMQMREWPSWVPKPPHMEVWKALGREYMSPHYVRTNWVDSIVTAREISEEQNKWSRGLDKEQRAVVDQYRQCLRGQSDICYVPKRTFPTGKNVDESMRKQWDKVAADINTGVTRIGALADAIETGAKRISSGADKAKLGKASGALRALGKWASTVAGKISVGATIDGLATDLSALASAARKFAHAKPGEFDAAAKELGIAALTFVKDLAIAASPPAVSVPLNIANAALCELNPDWVSDFASGVAKLFSGRSSGGRARRPTSSRASSLAERSNFNNINRR